MPELFTERGAREAGPPMNSCDHPPESSCDQRQGLSSSMEATSLPLSLIATRLVPSLELCGNAAPFQPAPSLSQMQARTRLVPTEKPLMRRESAVMSQAYETTSSASTPSPCIP